MDKKFNVKLFAGIVLGAMILSAFVHLLHNYQVKRNAHAIFQQAERAEEEGKADQAIMYLGRYLMYVPNDTEALARFGKLLNANARTAPQKIQAFLTLEQVLRREPQRKELRRELIQIAMNELVQRYSDARQHLEILLSDSDQQFNDLELLIARCHEQEGTFAQAAAWYQKAISHQPQQMDTYDTLARILRRRLNQPQQADDVMNALVANNPESNQSYLIRSQYYKDNGNNELAIRDVNKANALSPKEARVIKAVAEIAREQGRLDDARLVLQTGLKLHPRNVPIYIEIAAVEVQAQRPTEALAWIRKGLDEVPNHTELLWVKANLLIQLGQEPRDELQLLTKRGLPASQIELLNARILISQEKWLQAKRVLELVHSDPQSAPETTKHADFLLAKCYEQIGNLEQQYAAYRRAVNIDPTWDAASLALANTQIKLGRLDEALETYKRLTDRNPKIRPQIARVLIMRNLRLPATRRNWAEVEQALTDTEKEQPNNLELQLLRAEVLAAQNLLDKAHDHLHKIQENHPNRMEPWLALTAIQDRRGQPDEAWKILDQANQQLGNRPEFTMAAIELCIRQGGPDTAARLEKLSKSIDQFPQASRPRLQRSLAEAHLRLGNLPEAEKLWNLLAVAQPLDLSIKIVQLEIAMQTGKESVMNQLLLDMQQIEGSDGMLWRYGKVCQLITKARDGDKAALNQAQLLLEPLTRLPSSWPRLLICQAEINDLKGDQAAAIKDYLRAIDLGERHPQIVRRTVQLLYSRQRYAEAEEVLQRLHGNEPLTGDLQQLAVELSFRRGDFTRVQQLAKQVLDEAPKDYRQYLWVGLLMGSTPQSDQAEPLLRQAVALSDNVPDTWVALILFLARRGEKAKAEQALQEAEQKLKGPRTPLALAPCYEAVGKIDTAKKLFQDALTAKPGDAGTIRGLASFHLRHGQGAAAEVYLRQLIGMQTQAPEEAAWARRLLAIVLAASGDPQHAQHALSLLGLNEEGGKAPVSNDSLDEQRARALVLATQRNKSQRQKAIGLLVLMNSKQGLTPEDQFLLAQLYESVGDWPKAREQMMQLLAANSKKPLYVAHFAFRLLRRGETSEAAFWLAKLQQLPETANTFTVAEIKARLAAQRGKMDEAVHLVQAFLDDPQAKPTDPAVRQSLAVNLLDEFSLAKPAEKTLTVTVEKLYRRQMEQSPEKILALAAFLGRQGRMTEALNLCDQSWSLCPPDAVGNACLAALHAGPATNEHFQRVEHGLQTALTKNPKAAPALLVCMADLRDLQGQYGEARNLYRQVLVKDPRNLVALNNLAYLLALRENKGTEALELLTQAVAVAGPLPELLDTRALVHLKMGQTARALQDLDDALSTAPQPVLLFHLAQAHQLASNRVAAADAFRKALQLGLRAEQLHALERASFQQLRAELTPR